MPKPRGQILQYLRRRLGHLVQVRAKQLCALDIIRNIKLPLECTVKHTFSFVE